MSEANTQRHFFETLFKAFEERRLNYVVLHSWQTLPEIATSDVDMMISADEKSRLEDVLAEVAARSGWRFVQKLWYDVPWCFYYVAVSPDGNCSAALDFVSDPKGIGEYRIADDKILCHRESNGLLHHLTTEAELAYKLAKRRVKGIFRDEDLGFVNDYFAKSDGDVLLARMRELLPADVSRQLQEMMEHGAGIEAYRQYMQAHSPAFKLFNRRWRIQWHPTWFGIQFKRIIYRLAHPTGCVVFGTTAISFPHFVFRREICAARMGWFGKLAALSSATLVRATGDAVGYDAGTGMKSCEESALRELVYAEKKII